MSKTKLFFATLHLHCILFMPIVGWPSVHIGNSTEIVSQQLPLPDNWVLGQSSMNQKSLNKTATTENAPHPANCLLQSTHHVLKIAAFADFLVKKGDVDCCLGTFWASIVSVGLQAGWHPGSTTTYINSGGQTPSLPHYTVDLYILKNGAMKQCYRCHAHCDLNVQDTCYRR